VTLKAKVGRKNFDRIVFPSMVLESIRLHDIGTDVLVLRIFWAVMMVPAVIAFRRME